ncbi:MAG: protein translocase subunit SecD, partial [Rubripirellula sp.]|nr:protein translocase subunit SecD [Rubripirellula sp.]
AQARTGAGAVGSSISGGQYLAVIIATAVLIVPFFLGGYFAKKLRMPTYGTRFGWVLLAITVSFAVLANRRPGLGVDLSGGTILVYEVDSSKTVEAEAESGAAITSEDLLEPLTRRINPSGTQEIQIRPYGQSQIEIIIPEVNQQEIDRIKSLIEEAGVLRFAIVANERQHGPQINAAREQAASANSGIRTSENVVDANGDTIAFWANVDRELVLAEDGSMIPGPMRFNVGSALTRNPNTGEIIAVPPGIRDSESLTAEWIDQQGLGGIETLMIVEPNDADNVTGEDLAFAASVFDQNGAPAVAFTLTDSGSSNFLVLTTTNAPKGNATSQLGIVLDDDLLSAPNIQSPIKKEGRITGRFTREEVDRLVQILKAGALPAALTKQPIAENTIDATLGADTIQKGVTAIIGSLALVLVFILVYYRFSGLVACFALLLNLAMILATMVLINQPLTLPGLAGLVLTVGMSVDANVLIFERIREELKKGAADRMAIRNGFSKATITIVDANLTTLITAIVLYAIGTDQIRGFAVTLILGILFSMFTAIYVSRTIFDVSERFRCLSLKMTDGVNGIRAALTRDGNVDFMGLGKLTLTASAILILIGIASLSVRGRGILDIDFAGGSSVQFRLDRAMTTDEIRSIVKAEMTKPIGEILVDEGKLTEDQLSEAMNSAKVEGSDLATALIANNFVSQEEVDKARTDAEELPYTVNNVAMEGAEDNTIYKVDSSFRRVDDLKAAVGRAFESSDAVSLVTYDLAFGTTGDKTSSAPSPSADGTTADESAEDNAEPAAETQSSIDNSDNGVLLVSAISQDENDANQDAAESQEEAADEDTEVNAAAESDSEPAAAALTKIEVQVGVAGQAAGDSQQGAAISEGTLKDTLVLAAGDAGQSLTDRVINVTPVPLTEDEDAQYGEWTSGSQLRFTKWSIELPLDENQTQAVITAMRNRMNQDPVWVSSSSVGSRVAGDMIGRAFGALFASILSIIGYIWFRFQRVIYGFAAVAALIHDVLITLGAIAVSYWLADALGFLLIDPFKISLTVVAAILTIIGYSLNDTIVVFDRIRETKGKATKLTADMINSSINQTLSRTLLTSITTLIVVILLYCFGGEGIHAFAFALVVGVVVGTYSSIFIASPILLWLVKRGEQATT